MSFTFTLLRTLNGVPLTASGSRLTGSWDPSPEFETSTQQAGTVTVTRDAAGVRLQWDAESGGTAQSRLWYSIEADIGSSVDHYIIDWGDSGPTDTVPGYGLESMYIQADHVFTADSVTLTISAYDSSSTLLETDNIPITVIRSSLYAIDQWRMERFKGNESYTHPGERWVPDWVPYVGGYDLDYYDYDANEGWNWGYRLWLRSLDQQGRPDLTMVPGVWAETGTGEGS